MHRYKTYKMVSLLLNPYEVNCNTFRLTLYTILVYHPTPHLLRLNIFFCFLQDLCNVTKFVQFLTLCHHKFVFRSTWTKTPENHFMFKYSCNAMNARGSWKYGWKNCDSNRIDYRSGIM